MNLDTLMKLANTCNVVHFPQGIIIERGDSGFRAGILTKSCTYYPYDSSNKTPDGALDDLKAYVHNAAKKLAQQKHDEAARVSSEIQSLLSTQPEGTHP